MENKKIDFNDEVNMLEALAKNLKNVDNSKEKIPEIKEAKKSANIILQFLMPKIKGYFTQNKKALLLVLILSESLVYGIISQSYSLIKFIINLF